MTFPSPFESNPIPGLQGVAESLDLDAAEVQRIATALFQGALAPLEADKRKLATIKGNLVKPVAASIKAQDSRTLTEIGQRLRQHAAAQVADGDAELMLLASRLGSRQATGELVPVVQAAPAPTVAAPTGPTGLPTTVFTTPQPGAIDSTPWTCNAAGEWMHPIGGLLPGPPPGPGVNPAGYPLVPDRENVTYFLWVNNPGGWPYQFAHCESVPLPPTPPPAPPPPPQPYCEPCPVGVPPGGALPADPTACRRPAEATPQAVYIVPWIDPAIGAASAFSECGMKQIAEAQATLVPAAPIARALSREWGFVDVVAPLETTGSSIGFLEDE